MRYPATLPAIAILAGATTGALLAVPVEPVAVILTFAWIVSILAFVPRAAAGNRTSTVGRERGFLCAAAIGFWAGGSLLGATASRDALRPSLRTIFERELVETRRAGDLEATVEGLLRQDASISTSGVSLSLAVDRVTVRQQTRDASGGVILTVGGSVARGRMDEWRAGRRLRLPAHLRRPARYLDPGVPDEERSLARRGTTLVGAVKSGALVESVSNGTPFSEIAGSVRLWARRAIGRSVGCWSVRSAAIVDAIVLGDRAGLDAEVERRLQEAGTYHVIAISGSNVAILAALLLLILKLAGIGARVALIAAAVLLGAYAFLVGGSSSVTRATLMAVTYLIARIGDHRSPPMNALCVSAAIILAVAPLSIFDAGFALTYGATLGILLGAAPIVRLAPWRWIREPLALLAASLCAEAALLPVSAFAFSRVTFGGLVLNFAAIPLMSIAELAGFALLPLAAIHPGAAAVAGYVAHLGAYWLVESARLVDFAPWATRRIPPPSIAVMGTYYVGWIVWVAIPRLRPPAAAWRRWFVARRLAAATICGSALWIVIAPPRSTAAPAALRVTFLDVGQGDSALVRFSNGSALLVDAGGAPGASAFDIGARVVTPALWALDLRRLAYVALTHGDPDHIGGAPAVIRDFSPRELWEGIPVPSHGPLQAVRKQALESGATWRTLQTGDRLSIGETTLRVWHPMLPQWERPKVRNDDSIVLELRHGEASILLTGDIGVEVERTLAGSLAPARLRVLKVPHHGSASSSSPEFLAAVRPTVAVFSAGRSNRFGHPVPAIVQRYRDVGAAIFRTDEDGAVSVETDGQSMQVMTFTGRSAVFTAGKP